MLTVKGWARRSSIILVIVLSLALMLAGCGAGDSPSAGGGLNPTRTVGKKATTPPADETEEPTEEETEEPTEEETEEPTEETEEPTEETEEPTEEASGDITCPLTQEEVEGIIGESVSDFKEEGTAEAPQCTYTTSTFAVVSINLQDVGSEDGARMGIDLAKSSYENVEELDDVGDGAILASFSGVPILQGYKGSLLVTLTYFSLSSTDADANKQIMIDLAKAAFDKI